MMDGYFDVTTLEIKPFSCFSYNVDNNSYVDDFYADMKDVLLSVSDILKDLMVGEKNKGNTRLIEPIYFI